MGDRNDPDHAACRRLLIDARGALTTTAMVIAEAAYLLNRQIGPSGEVALYDDITGGLFNIATLESRDWQRIGDLVRRYADLNLGGTDASVIAVAERLGATEIATLDHRHFSVVRPNHVDTFTLVP